MIIRKLAEDVQAVATQTAVVDTVDSHAARFRPPTAILQVKVSGTATVKVYGRIHEDLAYEEIGTFTADAVMDIPYFPDMYSDVTVYSSGGVWVYVGHQFNR